MEIAAKKFPFQNGFMSPTAKCLDPTGNPDCCQQQQSFRASSHSSHNSMKLCSFSSRIFHSQNAPKGMLNPEPPLPFQKHGPICQSTDILILYQPYDPGFHISTNFAEYYNPD